MRKKILSSIQPSTIQTGFQIKLNNKALLSLRSDNLNTNNCLISELVKEYNFISYLPEETLV